MISVWGHLPFPWKRKSKSKEEEEAFKWNLDRVCLTILFSNNAAKREENEWIFAPDLAQISLSSLFLPVVQISSCHCFLLINWNVKRSRGIREPNQLNHLRVQTAIEIIQSANFIGVSLLFSVAANNPRNRTWESAKQRSVIRRPTQNYHNISQCSVSWCVWPLCCAAFADLLTHPDQHRRPSRKYKTHIVISIIYNLTTAFLARDVNFFHELKHGPESIYNWVYFETLDCPRRLPASIPNYIPEKRTKLGKNVKSWVCNKCSGIFLINNVDANTEEESLDIEFQKSIKACVSNWLTFYLK